MPSADWLHSSSLREESNREEVAKLRRAHALLRERCQASAQAAVAARAHAVDVRARSRRLLGPGLRAELPREIGCAGEARALLDTRLGRHSPAVRDEMRMVVSQLVTHAYRHGQGNGPISLRVCEREDHFRVDVFDHPSFDSARSASLAGGSSLNVVRSLAVRWGSHDGSSHMWAELSYRPD